MLVKCFILAILTLFFVLKQSDTARILAVLPTPSISHQVVFRPLTQELARRGHQLVIITADPAFADGDTPGNITEINIHNKSYEVWRKIVVNNVNGKRSSMYETIDGLLSAVLTTTETQLLDDAVQKLIRSDDEFDLLFIEACIWPMLAFSYKFKAPVILISSFGGIYNNYDVIGAPYHPILYPDIVNQKIYNLNILDKIKLVYNELVFKYVMWKLQKKENEILKRAFGPDVPKLYNLYDNVEMLFLNVHRIWEGNRPVPPGVIHMGGLHIKPPKELPKELKDYMDASVHGVIYMSFGTNVHPSLLPPEKIAIFMKVFSKLPHDVILKWDKDEIQGRPKNVKLHKWLPQADLLRHPKVKLFITQAGLQSTDEALIAGVPLLAFPMLGDQWYNADKYEHFKIGINMDLDTVTETTLEDAITTILDDDSYRQNIVKLARQMYDQPQSALERAVWWTEHVLRHGGARHLRAPAANMGWWQYLEIELVAVVAVAFILTSVTAVWVIHKVITKIYKYSNVAKIRIKKIE